MWMWILIGFDIITKLHGYTNGNFPQACESMVPNHETHAPQTTESPFMIDHVPSTNPGEPVTVILKSKGSTGFKGFMLEAREVRNEARLAGKFVLLEPDKTRLLSCHGLEDSAVSQKSNHRQTLIQVNWTATEAEQEIMFRATFLESYSKFWDRVIFTLPQRTTTPKPTTTEFSSTTLFPNSSISSTICSISNIEERAGTAVMCFDSILMDGKMTISNIAKVLLASEAFYHRLNEVTKIVGSMLCATVEISSMILLCMGDSCKVTLVALVCVATVINFTEVVIVSLTIGRSPEIKKISDLAVKVCFVIHEIFTIAVIFLGVMENDDSGNNLRESWLLKVMIAFTAWDFLHIIWAVVLSIEKPGECLVHKGSQRSEGSRQRRKWKSLRVAEVIAITVSVILIVGTITLAVAVIVGIFGCQKS